MNNFGVVQSYDESEFEILVSNDNFNFLLSHFNIRSFHANGDEMLLFLSKLPILPDILVLTETWFSPEYVGNIDGYDGHHVYRSDRRGGGVSVYVKRIHVSVVVPQFSYLKSDLELCTVKVVASGRQITVTGAYRPPGGNLVDFTERIKQVTLNSDPAVTSVLVGDFNIDLMNPMSFNCDYVYNCLSASFVPLITIPTHYSTNVSTCIDHIWCNNPDDIKSGVFDVSITDHYPIFLVTRISRRKDKFVKSFRDHSVSSLEQLHGKLIDFAGSPQLRDELMNLDSRVTFFNECLYNLYDQCCPIRMKEMSVNRRLKPWITNSLIDCIRYKYVLFRKFKKGLISFQRYNSYKNLLTSVIRRSKSQYFYNKFRTCQKNPKTTWRTINSLVNRTKDRPSVKEIRELNRVFSQPLAIANHFNSYFSGIATNLDDNIPLVNVSPIDYLGVANPASFFFRPVTEFDVKCTISRLPNRSSGLKCVPVYIFKYFSYILAPIISTLFNCSVECGSFPSCLKVARITPIYKKGDHRSVGNYRPICNLSLMSKIFEKLMYDRLLCFLNKFDLISDHQFGFRAKHSTTDAVTEFVDNACASLESKNILISVFLDLSKAFDTVNHSILLRKLYHYGIRGTVHRWFESYLRDRVQYVSIDDCSSDVSTVNIGVPQGSVLGPLLFILYINDMSRSSDVLSYVHFADDTTVFLKHDDPRVVEPSINLELNNVYTWLKANRLSLNISKTFYMVMTDRNVNDVSVNIDGSNIERVDKAKFLGISIDERLSFRYHVQDVCSHLARSVGMLRKLSSIVPCRVRLTIYNALIFSKVSYGVAAWGRGSNVSGIEKMLRNARKCISAGSCFDTSSILNFNSIYMFFVAVKQFKSIRLGEHRYFTAAFEELKPTHGHNTRFSNEDNFNIPFRYKTKSQRTFFYQSVLIWNSLPNDVRECTTLLAFKMKLREYLVSQQVISNVL